MRKYTIILEPDTEEGGYTVTVPALPGCITQGDTIEQCIERAQEAIAGYIESLIADGELVPGLPSSSKKLPSVIDCITAAQGNFEERRDQIGYICYCCSGR